MGKAKRWLSLGLRGITILGKMGRRPPGRRKLKRSEGIARNKGKAKRRLTRRRKAQQPNSLI